MTRIFYGVQGTGNGHITRARVMAKALKAAGFEVKFQFTGRPADKYFDMEIFGDYQVKSGLTFNTNKGQVSYLKTVLESQPITLIKDIRSLDLRGYDYVISDFEPVTAWAAKQQGIPVIGIGHQYAFQYQIPREGTDPMAEQVMRLFAPANIGVGLHWHHFGQPILPPIIETPDLPEQVKANKIVVYLPFEDSEAVIKHLSPFENFEFHVYSPQVVPSKYAHIVCKPLSRDGFQADVHDCAGIISNAGFELASEALQLGKKILVKPLHAQMEQISNAAAIKQLGYGKTMFDIDVQVIEDWLHDAHAVRINYPKVADILVQWLLDGKPAIDQAFVANVWKDVEVLAVN
jgi:uncharacterized protein (TIGR00661 family)